MSKRVQEAIKEKVVKPELDAKQNEITGKVKKTYFRTVDNKKNEIINVNMADVEIKEPKTGTKRVMQAVPIIINSISSNIDGDKIKKGDKVTVSFYNGDSKHPRITGRLFTNPKEWQQQMTTKQGTFIPDFFGFFG